MLRIAQWLKYLSKGRLGFNPTQCPDFNLAYGTGEDQGAVHPALKRRAIVIRPSGALYPTSIFALARSGFANPDRNL